MFKVKEKPLTQPMKSPSAKILAMVGQKYGRLTVVSYAGVDKTLAAHMHCTCDCGETCVVGAYQLKVGTTRSCGCLRVENYRLSNLKHGRVQEGAYKSWANMRKRCLDPKSIQWKDYGGRGIKIHPSWESFEVFYADMGDRPEGMTLDREDTNGDYTKENCKWSTSTEQARNRTSSKLITYRGETKPLVEWCEQLDLPYHRTYSRLAKGLDYDSVFSKETRSLKSTTYNGT